MTGIKTRTLLECHCSLNGNVPSCQARVTTAKPLPPPHFARQSVPRNCLKVRPTVCSASVLCCCDCFLSACFQMQLCALAYRTRVPFWGVKVKGGTDHPFLTDGFLATLLPPFSWHLNWEIIARRRTAFKFLRFHSMALGGRVNVCPVFHQIIRRAGSTFLRRGRGDRMRSYNFAFAEPTSPVLCWFAV